MRQPDLSSPNRRSRTRRGPITRRLLAGGGAAIGLLVAWSQATAVPTSDWRDYTLIAQQKLVIGPNINISGSFAVISSGGAGEIQHDTFQLDAVPHPFVAADKLELGARASIVDAFTNDLKTNSDSEVRGTTSVDSFPLAIPLPTLPAGVFDDCTLTAPHLNVPANGEETLLPGCHGDIEVRQGGRLIVPGGEYKLRSLKLHTFGTMRGVGGAVTLLIRRNLETEDGAWLGHANGLVESFNLSLGSDKGAKSSVGPDSFVAGILLAPNDDNLTFRKGATLVGTAIGAEIQVKGQHEDRPPTPTPSPTPSPSPTPKPTPTPTPKPTPTPTPKPTPTPTPKPSPTPTPKPSPTPTASPSPSPSPTPRIRPTPTPSASPTRTPSPTATPRPSASPSPRPSPTPRPSATPTPKPSATPTPKPSATPTRKPSPTLSPRPTPTPTSPFVPPTPTATVRKKPWGRKPGIISPYIPPRGGGQPGMGKPLPSSP